MAINKESFSKFLETLEGLNWCFFAGLAVSIYTDGKRKVGDIDILIEQKNIKEFAKRLNTKAKRRFFKKENILVDDFGFKTKFLGIEIEASSGFPQKRLKDGTIKKIFKNKVRKKYLGFDVFVEPIEEILIHKALMEREKDLKDLKMLLLKSKENINYKFLEELLNDWGEKKETILENLKNVGYNVY